MGSINIAQVISAICGSVFILFGITFSNTTYNRYVGLRTKWTLADPAVWKKTHQICAVTWVLGGGLMVANLLARSQNQFLMTFVLGLGLVLISPYICSYVLYKKHRE